MIYWRDADFSKYKEPAKYRRNHYYSNLVAAFDTETTAIINHDPEYAFVYEWTLGVEDLIVYGRTWDELRELLLNLKADLGLSSDYKLIVFDQRLKYEFAFLKSELWVNDEDFLARNNHDIIKATICDAYQFRASDQYSEQPLDVMGSLMGIPKVSGYDYSLIRHCETPLSDFEFKYCETDVRILLEYFKSERRKYGDVKRIPLTATRTIKEDIYRNYQEIGSVASTRANQLRDTPEDQLMLSKIQRAFFGGWNYSNLMWDNIEAEDVTSADRSSDYAAQMLLNRYPLKKFKKTDNIGYLDLYEQITDPHHNYHYLVVCSIEGLENIYPRAGFLPLNQDWDWDPKDPDLKIIGDKILKCSRLLCTLTDVDFALLFDFYSFKDIKIYELYKSRKGFLPNYIVKTIVERYRVKLKAKRWISQIKKDRLPTIKEAAEYSRIKSLVSRIYGVFVQKPLLPQYKYNSQSRQIEPLRDDNGDLIEEFVKGDYDPVLYQWGVWVTSYARRDELCLYKQIDLWVDDNGIPHNRDNVLYGDTDSIKFVGNADPIIAQYNDDIKQKIAYFCYHNQMYGYTPEDLEGLGVYDIEHYQRFKTIGVKKYAYIDDKGQFVAKIAGLSLDNLYFDQFETAADKLAALDPEMQIPADLALNRSISYYDNHIVDEVTDYLGNAAKVEVKSCCVLGVQRFDSRRHSVKVGAVTTIPKLCYDLRRKKLTQYAQKNIDKNINK